MIIYTNPGHALPTHIVRDTDGEIMIGIDGPRGPITVEIHAGDEATIERILEHGDDDDLEGLCSAIVNDFYTQVGRCFPGETFSHYADAPDDNSELVTRPRTAQEIQEARNAIAYRDLVDAGLTENEILALLKR